MEEICWILGRGGLLGGSLQAIVHEERSQEFVPSRPFTWHDQKTCFKQLRAATAEFAKAAQGKQWRIYWAAGTGTMGSKEEDLKKEMGTLEELLLILGETTSLMETNGTLIYASSAGALYGGCKDDIITEDSDVCPETPYARIKLTEEELLKGFAKRYSTLSLFIARITNLYGPAQSKYKRQGLISHIARSILRRQPVNIFVPFDTIRDYIPADTAAKIIVKTVQKLSAGETVTKIVASEEPTTIARIIGAFTAITRLPPRVITSASNLSNSYPHRMCFRSIVATTPIRNKTLIVGVSEVLAAEKRALMEG